MRILPDSELVLIVMDNFGMVETNFLGFILKKI